MNAPKSLPRKIMVRETGLVTNGTMLPLSNSLEMLFMRCPDGEKEEDKPEFRQKLLRNLG